MSTKAKMHPLPLQYHTWPLPCFLFVAPATRGSIRTFFTQLHSSTEKQQKGNNNTHDIQLQQFVQRKQQPLQFQWTTETSSVLGACSVCLACSPTAQEEVQVEYIAILLPCTAQSHSPFLQLAYWAYELLVVAHARQLPAVSILCSEALHTLQLLFQAHAEMQLAAVEKRRRLSIAQPEAAPVTILGASDSHTRQGVRTEDTRQGAGPEDTRQACEAAGMALADLESQALARQELQDLARRWQRYGCEYATECNQLRIRSTEQSLLLQETEAKLGALEKAHAALKVKLTDVSTRAHFLESEVSRWKQECEFKERKQQEQQQQAVQKLGLAEDQVRELRKKLREHTKELKKVTTGSKSSLKQEEETKASTHYKQPLNEMPLWVKDAIAKLVKTVSERAGMGREAETVLAHGALRSLFTVFSTQFQTLNLHFLVLNKLMPGSIELQQGEAAASASESSSDSPQDGSSILWKMAQDAIEGALLHREEGEEETDSAAMMSDMGWLSSLPTQVVLGLSLFSMCTSFMMSFIPMLRRLSEKTGKSMEELLWIHQCHVIKNIIYNCHSLCFDDVSNSSIFHTKFLTNYIDRHFKGVREAVVERGEKSLEKHVCIISQSVWASIRNQEKVLGLLKHRYGAVFPHRNMMVVVNPQSTMALEEVMRKVRILFPEAEGRSSAQQQTWYEAMFDAPNAVLNVVMPIVREQESVLDLNLSYALIGMFRGMGFMAHDLATITHNHIIQTTSTTSGEMWQEVTACLPADNLTVIPLTYVIGDCDIKFKGAKKHGKAATQKPNEICIQNVRELSREHVFVNAGAMYQAMGSTHTLDELRTLAAAYKCIIVPLTEKMNSSQIEKLRRFTSSSDFQQTTQLEMPAHGGRSGHDVHVVITHAAYMPTAQRWVMCCNVITVAALKALQLKKHSLIGLAYMLLRFCGRTSF